MFGILTTSWRSLPLLPLEPMLEPVLSRNARPGRKGLGPNPNASVEEPWESRSPLLETIIWRWFDERKGDCLYANKKVGLYTKKNGLLVLLIRDSRTFGTPIYDLELCI